MNTFVKNILLASTLSLTSLSTYAAGLLSPVGSNQPLQIQSHEVNVTLEEGFTITEVTQVFSNPSSQDLEALYSFPIPIGASVGEFTYWIDGKPVHGEVLEKKKAKTLYEQERSAGREAALVEKNEFKTFEILVTPVKANNKVKIKLVYLQKAHVDLGIGKYVYPLADGGTDQQAASFWSSKQTVEQNFSFNIHMRSAYPIETLRFASHTNAQVKKNAQGEWTGSIANSSNSSEGNTQQAAAELNKDIVVYWKHPSNLPASIDLTPYKETGQAKGSFALSITPSDMLKPIQQGKDWVFVLDVSGSMNGKLSTLSEGVVQAIEKMEANNRVRVITFSDSAKDVSGGYVTLDTNNKPRLIHTLRNLRTEGGTNLYAGIKESIYKLDENKTSSIILVTDGVANVGPTEKKAFFQLLDDNDLRLFTFIMGNSANEPLLSSMTKHSNGFAQSISTSDEIIGQILWAIEKVQHEAFHDIQVEIDGVRTSDLSPEKLGSFYKGQQINLFGHYWKSGKATVKVSGKVSGKEVSWEQEVIFPDVSTSHPEIERLWAFAKIQSLLDKMEKFGESNDDKQSIQDIALEYGLVTDYTSMLVMREDIFKAENIPQQNKKRIENENQQRTQRQQSPVANKPANTQTANTQQQRASFSSGGSGGGSFGHFALLAISSLLLMRKKRI